jgi:hypothetical protein
MELIDSEGGAVEPSRGRPALPVSRRAIEVVRTGTGAYYTDVEVRGTALRMYVSHRIGSCAHRHPLERAGRSRR